MDSVTHWSNARSLADPAALGAFNDALAELSHENPSLEPEALPRLMACDAAFGALWMDAEYAAVVTRMESTQRDELSPQGEALARELMEISATFARVFQDYAQAVANAALPDAKHPLELVIARGLSHYCDVIRLGCYINVPNDRLPWIDMHGLYRFAELQGVVQSEVKMAGDGVGTTTPMGIYVKALMLDALHTGNLSRAQLAVADSWLNKWSPEYGLDEAFNSRQHSLFVDLQKNLGLKRVREEEPTRTMRFLRLDPLRAQLETVKAALRQGLRTPAGSMAAQLPITEHAAALTVLERFYGTLASTGQSRIEERKPVEGRSASVAIGLDLFTAAAVQGMASPAGVSTYRWKVNDISSRGFGFLVNREVGQQVVLNAILGVWLEQSGRWALATAVRRVAHEQEQEVLIGAELLSTNPIAVELTPAPPAEGDSTPVAKAVQLREPVTAFFLPGQADDGSADSLLMPLAAFAADLTRNIATPRGTFLIRLNRAMRRGSDWVLAGFDVETRV